METTTVLSQADQLTAILSKLEALEAHLQRIEQAVPPFKADTSSTFSADEAVLIERLDRLTLKRHAVLTATLGGVSYDSLAAIMKCSSTTVKLQLKGALETLGIAGRSSLLASHRQLLKPIPDHMYLSRYGIHKRWWLEENKDLMDVLTTTKPTNNQHSEVEP